MLRTTILVLATVAGVAGCAPYVYKSEINAFSSGVENLATAYKFGLKSLASERAAQERLRLSSDRPPVALSEDCEVSLKVPEGGPPCMALAGRREPIPVSPVERQAMTAAPVVQALRDYADALAAVTNAEDEAQLEAAQAMFRDSVESLVKLQSDQAATRVSPVVELLGAGWTAYLNQRRFEVLKTGVNAANAPVAKLGKTLGEAFATLRVAQALQLRTTANAMASGLVKNVSAKEYEERLALVERKAADLETLRRTDPRAVADDMVRGHEALRVALNDNTRQSKAVVEAVKQFVERARAVRDAFQGGKDG